MPRKDLYHELVVEALEREGWTITDDPLRLSIADTNVYVDLGAELVLGARKAELEIAVEIKSFVSPPLYTTSRQPLVNTTSTGTCCPNWSRIASSI